MHYQVIRSLAGCFTEELCTDTYTQLGNFIGNNTHDEMQKIHSTHDELEKEIDYKLTEYELR